MPTDNNPQPLRTTDVPSRQQGEASGKIRLTDEGRKQLRQIIMEARQENPKAIARIEEVLGPLDDIALEHRADEQPRRIGLNQGTAEQPLQPPAPLRVGEEWRTIIVGLPIIRKLLNAEDVSLETLKVSLIPDDVLFNARPASQSPATASEPLRMLDGKFGITNGGKLVKASSGEEIPEWEPLHIMRARDRLSLPFLRIYRELSVKDGCNEYHLAMVDAQIQRFEKFEAEHPEWMKQPGVTKGAKFTPVLVEPASERPASGDWERERLAIVGMCQENRRIEREVAERVRKETLKERFNGHRLLGMQCNHEEKTDTWLCECGSTATANTVGAAFDSWLNHVLDVLVHHRALASQPPEASGRGAANSEGYIKCRCSDKKHFCHVCERETDMACSDCRINLGVSVYVCKETACRDEHERAYCSGPNRIAPGSAAAAKAQEEG